MEIKLNDVRQLFNSLDPSPFHEKDLENSAAEYIIESAREFHDQEPLKLVLHLPLQACDQETARIVTESIHFYFDYRSSSAKRELRFTLKQGRTALIIGLTFLFMCIAAQQFIASLESDEFLWQIIKEGFLISGWLGRDVEAHRRIFISMVADRPPAPPVCQTRSDADRTSTLLI